MGPRLARALAAALASAVVGLGASLGVAQQNTVAEPSANTAAPVVAPAPAATPPTSLARPSEAAPAPGNEEDNTDASTMAEPSNVQAPPPEKPTAPIPPPRPVRGQVAVLQVLDKVTAETMRFEAPVGGRVRYKSLIIEVKVCETRGPDEPQPKSSAYLDVTSDPRATVRADLITRKEVFKGWMFSAAPAVHALQHPTFDLWLITCGATPAAAQAPASGR